MIRLALLALAFAAANPSAVFASTLEGQSAVSGTPATLNGRCDLTAGQPSTTDADCARRWFDGQLRLNDLLVIGSHNSYKARVPDNELAVIASVSASVARHIDYGYPSLTAELDAGARQLELDIYYDPKGGRYLTPMVVRRAKADMGEAWKAAMARPGFKAFHMVDVDVHSSCITFRACLSEIRAWSDAHPQHVPITILINAKDGHGMLGEVKPLSFDAAAFDALDGEVRAELADRLITPDMVQGTYPTLREAVLADNWPTLGDARGHILFALDETPRKVALYRGNRKSLEGRAMFVNAPDENSPEAAYFTINNPRKHAETIRRRVAEGFIVRTRADSNTREARANDTAPRDTALAGGAQFISTDYLWADPRLPGGYHVALPGASAVCNPVRTGKRCAGLPIETQAPIGSRPPDDGVPNLAAGVARAR
jgi:hypothetical protein